MRTDHPYCVKRTPLGETCHSGSPSRAKKWRWERDTRRCFCCVPPGTRQVPGTTGIYHEIMRKEHIRFLRISHLNDLGSRRLLDAASTNILSTSSATTESAGQRTTTIDSSLQAPVFGRGYQECCEIARCCTLSKMNIYHRT